jgi:predicted lactoylglutathione lyase
VIAVDATSHTEFGLGHAVESREEVDAMLARARAAGARLTGGPRDRPWGIYSGYFEDPDGHLWEVIWNHELAGEGATLRLASWPDISAIAPKGLQSNSAEE